MKFGYHLLGLKKMFVALGIISISKEVGCFDPN